VDEVTPELENEIRRVFALQRANRSALKASTAQTRIARLNRLRAAIVAHAEAINAALHSDLRKMPLGLKAPEVSSVLKDIDEAVAGLHQWMQPDVIANGPAFGGNDARVLYEPRGVVLLFGPWNFPFSLVMAPLVPIIAAGNAAIVKPNELQPATSAITAKILREVFDTGAVAVFEGGVALADRLLELPFDHIFFTGSPAIGRRVMAAAARHLTSVTLELGGKCPAVIGDGANLTDAAAKIVGARLYNSGQLCLSVDHVWVPEALRESLVAKLVQSVQAGFYAGGELQKARLSRIVNARNLARVRGYVEDARTRGAKVVFGGEVDEADLTIHPTILIDVPLDARLMQEEIFGPVLPVLTYRHIDEVTDFIDRGGKPLALYVFSPDEGFVENLLQKTSSGGVTVNGVLSHAGESRLPFGGVNQSGMGRYKSIHGFRELSHARSVFTHPPAASSDVGAS
jgi:aldehyde dehydrogenase (NAD+)